jgi:TRAP-type transport system periplasmic protein
METVADIFKKNYKVADAQRMFSEFRPLLERWSSLVANVNDAKSLGQLYYTEVFSKLDPATYGVD